MMLSLTGNCSGCSFSFFFFFNSFLLYFSAYDSISDKSSGWLHGAMWRGLALGPAEVCGAAGWLAAPRCWKEVNSHQFPAHSTFILPTTDKQPQKVQQRASHPVCHWVKSQAFLDNFYIQNLDLRVQCFKLTPGYAEGADEKLQREWSWVKTACFIPWFLPLVSLPDTVLLAQRYPAGHIADGTHPKQRVKVVSWFLHRKAAGVTLVYISFPCRY